MAPKTLDPFRPRIRSESNVAEVLRKAIAAHKLGDLAQAKSLYNVVLSISGHQFDALHLLGVLEAQNGNLEVAHRLVIRALKVNAASAEAYTNLGRIQHEMRQHQDALASCNKALLIDPKSVVALNVRASALQALKRFDDALADYDKALAIAPQHAETAFNRANVLFELARLNEALEAYDRALALRPDFAAAQIGRGNVLLEWRRFEEALAAYDNALAAQPHLGQAYVGRGRLFFRLRRFSEALSDFEKALALGPNLSGAWNGRGTVLFELRRYQEALAAFGRAIELEPRLAEAWLGRGNVCLALHRFDQAMEAYDSAVALRPNLSEAWNGRGNLCFLLKRFDEAIASYDRALSANPDLQSLRGLRLHAQMNACDWSDFDEQCGGLTSAVNDGVLALDPFYILTIPSSPSEQLRCAQLYVADRCPNKSDALFAGKEYHHDKIRIAYLSSDFRRHPMSYVIVELFERHDRSRFDVHGISFGPNDNSDARARVAKAFDHFHDVTANTDFEITKLMADLEIDIAVDLNGHTQNARLGILANRSAPIQVSYLGYPGTMGAEFIDYILADRFVIPEKEQVFYSEKVVYLPDSYWVNDTQRRASAKALSRTDCGLPERGFVFCCFNNTFKITPAVFGVWMRLLDEVEGSVLWLLQSNDLAKVNLRREAERRGIAADRLVFAPHAEMEYHLARHRLADLALDTLPYNAHTTATDALWMEVPMVTCAGTTFAGRVGASLLNAIGVPELITNSFDEYEALALRISQSPELLAGLKTKLARNRLTFPLFDTTRLARHFESAYVTMWERCRRKERPEGFAVHTIT